MDPADFLSTARDLCLPIGKREADYRSAISRAYYAVFLTVRERLGNSISFELRMRAQLSKQLTHDWTIRSLCNCGISEIEGYGIALKSLQSARHLADYDMKKVILFAKANEEIANAQDLCDEMNAFGLDKIAAVIAGKLELDHPK